MAVKKGKRRHHTHYLGGKKPRDTAKLSEMLAPLEEHPHAQKSQQVQALQAQTQAHDSQNHNGVIIVDGSSLKVPSDFVETDDADKRLLNLEPVVLAILLMSLAFIAFIAYLISTEPAKP